MMALPQSDDIAGLAPLTAAIGAAQRSGFDRVWLPQLPAAAGSVSWDALTALAVAGQHARTIGLASGVAVAYGQHPLVLARQALTTNAAVDGRFTLGIGVSHPQLITALGYSYDKPVAFLREYLEVLIPALAGEAVDHHGPRITAVGQLDLGGPPPRIVAAALGPRMLDLAGELTDGMITSWAGPKTLATKIVPRITAAAAGRARPQVIAGLPVVLTADADAARQAIAEAFAFPQKTPAYRAVLAAEGVAGVADVSIVGDENEVAAGLRRFAEAGATEFVPAPFGDAATVARTTELLAGLRF